MVSPKEVVTPAGEPGASRAPFSETKHSILSILDLPERLALLPESERQLIDRLFEITVETGSPLVIPEPMEPFVVRTFGSGRSPEETLELTRSQQVVTVQDRYLKAEAVYNALRRKRPQPTTGESSFQRDILDEGKMHACPFCAPELNTPYDSELGRLLYGNVFSAVNVTKFAPEHALALGRHNPYETTRDEFGNQINMLTEWARLKSRINPSNKFLRIGSSRGYRAGGSQVHDHWQGELRQGTMHFPYAERLNEVAYYYQFPPDHKGADFFDDFFRVHKTLGLGIQRGSARVISMLVPSKEHGIMVIDNEQTEGFTLSDDFIDALWEVQQFMLQEEGVREYNIFILPRPNRPDSMEYWSRYRSVAVFVDRGHSTSQNSDWGYAELSGTSVNSYDPFDFGPRLNEYLQSAASV